MLYPTNDFELITSKTSTAAFCFKSNYSKIIISIFKVVEECKYTLRCKLINNGTNFTNNMFIPVKFMEKNVRKWFNYNGTVILKEKPSMK